MAVHLVDTLNLQILNVGHATVGHDWNWTDVYSPFTRILCATGGQAWIIVNNVRVSLRPGMLYLVPAYTRHSYICDDSFSHYYIIIYEGVRSGSLFDRYALPVEIPSTANDEELFAELCRRHPQSQLTVFNPKSYDNQRSIASSYQRFNGLGDADKMYIRGAVLLILSRFFAAGSPRLASIDKRIESVVNYIDEHLDSNMSLDTLAEVACISKAYLIRLFTLGYGMTPIVYINRRRVEKAQLMLFTTSMSVKEIAYALGFTDNSYFNRLFKKYTGLTPMNYRLSS